MDSIRVAAPALITAAPSLGRHELRKRQSQTLDPGQVCGYISGDPDYPLTCPGSSTCNYGGAQGNWGCCDSVACWRPAHCENAGTPYCGNIGSANCPYSQIQQCSDPASPACITFVRETTVGDSNKFTSWGCAPTSTIFTALEGVTGGSGGGGSFPLSSSTSGSLTGSSSSPTTTSANSPSNTNNNYDPLSKPAEIGTIVGTVLAFIAIVISIYYGQKRIRDHRNAAQNP